MSIILQVLLQFFLYDTAATEIYPYCHTLALPQALPNSVAGMMASIYTIAAYIGHAFAPASPLAGRDLANTVPAMSATTPAPAPVAVPALIPAVLPIDRKSTRLNSSH